LSHYKRNAAVGSVVAFAVALSIGIGILYIPSSGIGSATSSSVTTYFTPVVLPTSSKSTVNPNGLQFLLSLKDPNLKENQPVTISMSVYNTLSKPNSVIGISNWRYLWLTDNLYCPSPYDAVILSGYYTESNVTSGVQLQTKEPGSVSPCPAAAGYWWSGSSSFVFQPQSSNVSGMILNNSLTFRGSWNLTSMQEFTSAINATMPAAPPYFLPFSPAIYTVVGGDEWGDVALLYFIVSK
jgi:hypothetical protein